VVSFLERAVLLDPAPGDVSLPIVRQTGPIAEQIEGLALKSPRFVSSEF
jgi:hypothetical protein